MTTTGMIRCRMRTGGIPIRALYRINAGKKQKENLSANNAKDAKDAKDAKV